MVIIDFMAVYRRWVPSEPVSPSCLIACYLLKNPQASFLNIKKESERSPDGRIYPIGQNVNTQWSPPLLCFRVHSLWSHR